MSRAREDIDVSEEPPRKKQRTTVASNACTNCRSRHIKCSGESPCKRCQGLQGACYYGQQKKRGLAAGQVEDLKATIEVLKQQLAEKTKQLNEHEAKEAKNKKDAPRIICSLQEWRHYVALYKERLYSTFRVHPAFCDPALLRDQPDPSYKMLMYLLLAVGAFAAGKASEGKDMMVMGRKLLRKIHFVNPLVVAAHFLLSKCHLVFAEFEKARYHGLIAKSFSHSLLEENVKSPWVDLSHVYVVSSISAAKPMHAEQRLEAMREICQKAENTLPFDDSYHRHSLMSGINVNRLWLEALVEFWHSDSPHLSEELVNRYLFEIDYVVGSSSSAVYSADYLHICKAWIVLLGGFSDAAEKIADMIFEQQRSRAFILLYFISSFVMLAQLYLYLRKLDKFHHAIQTFETHFRLPIGGAVKAQLLKLLEEQTERWNTGLNTSLKMFLDRSAVLLSTLYVGDGRSYMYAGNNNGNNINDEIVAYSNHVEFSDVDIDSLLAGDSPQPFCGL
jgi:hypothetical protein